MSNCSSNCNCENLTLPVIAGPQGPQGIQGIQGPAGTPGTAGGAVIQTNVLETPLPYIAGEDKVLTVLTCPPNTLDIGDKLEAVFTVKVYNVGYAGGFPEIGYICSLNSTNPGIGGGIVAPHFFTTGYTQLKESFIVIVRYSFTRTGANTLSYEGDFRLTPSEVVQITPDYPSNTRTICRSSTFVSPVNLDNEFYLPFSIEQGDITSMISQLLHSQLTLIKAI